MIEAGAIWAAGAIIVFIAWRIDKRRSEAHKEFMQRCHDWRAKHDPRFSTTEETNSDKTE